MVKVGTVFWFAVYWAVFTPLALVFRLFRRDPLLLDRPPQQASYWQSRRSKGFRPMTTQY